MIFRNAILVLVLSSGAVLGQNAVYTAADSVQIVQFLEDSAIEITDRNGDCLISDIDVILTINQRLIAQYGEAFEVGDVDGDGLDSTAMDVVIAIRQIIAQGFGDANHDGIVTQQDLAIIGQWVSNGQIEGDINLDGQIDVLDSLAANDQLGTQISQNALLSISFRVYDGLSQLHEEGIDAFMASGCAPEDHTLGVSSTWPAKKPSWWPSNHQTSISTSYTFPTHEYWSTHTSYNDHDSSVSKTWPANHLFVASNTWLPPQSHTIIISWQTPSPEVHGHHLSKTWPTGHRKFFSDTWQEHGDHDQVVSRTWWPNHEKANSHAHTWPPPHINDVSQTWIHDSTLSTSKWPPSHSPQVSDGWGVHQSGLSVTYPPNHVSYASITWPGPVDIWPPSHSYAASVSWGEPMPGSWPVFPPDHTWLTSFKDVRDLIEPPSPWPNPWPWQ